MFIMSRKLVNVEKFKEFNYSIHSKERLPAQQLDYTFPVDFGPLLKSLGHLDGRGRINVEGRAVALFHMNRKMGGL
jgi:hypothetical protein